MQNIANQLEKRNVTHSFESPDFYGIDDLLTEEHKLIRSSMRDFVNAEILPIIEDSAEKCLFHGEIIKKFGDIGAFGINIPTEYGGGGMDYISYGIAAQEIERGNRWRELYRNGLGARLCLARPGTGTASAGSRELMTRKHLR